MNSTTPQPSQGSRSLHLRDLCVDLKEFRLREIDLDVAAGEYFVVLGPTGAGKTVLLETIAGLFQPRRGRVRVDGRDITDLPPEHRGIGFVYQDYALFPHLNVAENIGFGLSIQGDPVKDLVRRICYPTKIAEDGGRDRDVGHRVEAISRLLLIDHLLHRSPKTLSGGEQQRVALARALVVEPRLLLLDEPLSALDPDTREGLQLELTRVHRQLGTTTLHVTHDFEEAAALGDRIAVVHEGRIVQVGTSADIFRRPANQFVARFVGVRNIFAGTVGDADDDGYKRFSLDPSTASDRSDLKMAVLTDLSGAVHASIRPEDIILSPEPLPPGVRNCFLGSVVKIADRGTFIYVTVNAPPHFTCVMTRRSLEEMALGEDKEVHIAFKASAVHIF